MVSNKSEHIAFYQLIEVRMKTTLGHKRFIANNLDAYTLFPGESTQVDSIFYDVANITYQFIEY